MAPVGLRLILLIWTKGALALARIQTHTAAFAAALPADYVHMQRIYNHLSKRISSPKSTLFPKSSHGVCFCCFAHLFVFSHFFTVRILFSRVLIFRYFLAALCLAGCHIICYLNSACCICKHGLVEIVGNVYLIRFALGPAASCAVGKPELSVRAAIIHIITATIRFAHVCTPHTHTHRRLGQQINTFRSARFQLFATHVGCRTRLPRH